MTSKAHWRAGRYLSGNGEDEGGMTKRAMQFRRRPRDFYPTPYEAVVPLIPHLGDIKRYCEPCAGDGALVDHLSKHGLICARARDVAPRRKDIERKDALTTLTGNIDAFITNPPWDRTVMHPMIDFLSAQHPTWLLIDSDWAHTKQAVPYLVYCRKIVSIGRVKWIPNSKMTGKDNCAWYLFDQSAPAQTMFVGRAA
jgi:hypothetical protein